MHNTQLICTFCSADLLDATLAKILRTYDIAFDMIYVLENVDDDASLCLTYNINTESDITNSIPDATISLHRKKSSNTLYTINALNLLIAELNGGKLDRNYRINWPDYQNTILVSAKGSLRKIKTKLRQIIKVSDLLV